MAAAVVEGRPGWCCRRGRMAAAVGLQGKRRRSRSLKKVVVYTKTRLLLLLLWIGVVGAVMIKEHTSPRFLAVTMRGRQMAPIP